MFCGAVDAVSVAVLAFPVHKLRELDVEMLFELQCGVLELLEVG